VLFDDEAWNVVENGQVVSLSSFREPELLPLVPILASHSVAVFPVLGPLMVVRHSQKTVVRTDGNPACGREGTEKRSVVILAIVTFEVS